MRIPWVALRSEISLPEVAAEEDCRSPFEQLIKCGMRQDETYRQIQRQIPRGCARAVKSSMTAGVTSNPYRKCTRRS